MPTMARPFLVPNFHDDSEPELRVEIDGFGLVEFESPPFPPPHGMYERLESALHSVVETSQTYLQQALSAINDATAALLKVSFTIGTTEQLINSAAVPFTGEYKVVYDHLVSEYLQTLQNLDIKGAWTGVGQAWGMFREKMQGLESGVDALKKRCSSGFIAQLVSSTATKLSSGAYV
jgi:hypothetical protein